MKRHDYAMKRHNSSSLQLPQVSVKCHHKQNCGTWCILRDQSAKIVVVFSGTRTTIFLFASAFFFFAPPKVIRRKESDLPPKLFWGSTQQGQFCSFFSSTRLFLVNWQHRGKWQKSAWQHFLFLVSTALHFGFVKTTTKWNFAFQIRLIASSVGICFFFKVLGKPCIFSEFRSKKWIKKFRLGGNKGKIFFDVLQFCCRKVL
jgi:hypothetical protein